MENKFLTNSPAQTQKVGRELAKRILKDGRKDGAVVLALLGDLGGGKTTFLQGFAKGLGLTDKILSPTFVIMKKFKIQSTKSERNSWFKNFYHFDCYRLKDSKDILELSSKKELFLPENIVAIEWAERVKDVLPAQTIQIEFKFVDNKKRKIIIS
jgi:tRNA threonylcarbamoyladenosine biosynthesis protein TsaE